MIYAHINIATGLVDNIVLFDGEPFAAELGHAYVPGVDARIGDRFENGGFVRTETAMPVETVTPEEVSDRQFFQALALRGHITEEEALDAVGPGIIPAQMAGLIDQLPESARFGARMLIRGEQVYQRSSPLAGLIGQLYGWDDAALDELWTFAATL